MGILEDIMKTLDRVPGWKRISALPGEVDALSARVASLEARLKPGTGKQCPSCAAMTYRLMESRAAPPPWGALGAMEDHFACGTCNYTNTVQRNPGS